LKKKYFIIGVIISSVSIILIILRIIWPFLKIDDITVYFLLISVIPWISFFIKKFKAGDWEIEGLGEQGKNDAPPPAAFQPPIDPGGQQVLPSDQNPELSDMAKKILATLWRYQKQTFKDDYSLRWTFALYPHAPEYSKYKKGVEELINLFFIQRQADRQVLLTNEGIQFIEDHKEIQNYKDIFLF
jgi:hypothetical protein